MNTIIEKDFAPHTAIIVYSQKGEYNEHYLESREIREKENGYHMLSGKPLTKKLLSQMLEEIDPIVLEKIYCKGLLPSNLLTFDNNNATPTIIWKVESSLRNLCFAKVLRIKDGTMCLPTLIFKLKGSSLSVFAVKTNNVNKDTKLYHAPFHNIFSDGKVCMGNAKTYGFKEVNSIMKNWEDAFFQSKFSHLQGQGSPINGNLNTFIKRQMKPPKQPFDKGVLVSINQKLEDIL